MYKEKCDLKDCKFNINLICFNKTHSFISCGNSKKKKVIKYNKGGNDSVVITKRQLEAIKWRRKGLSFSEVGKKLNISKKNAHKLYNKAIITYKGRGGNDKGGGVTIDNKGGNDIRLHNDVVSFLIEPIDFWGEPNIVNLKYTSYLNVNTGGEHIKIFSCKLVVRFKGDIVGKSVEEVKFKSEERIKFFLSSFDYKGIVLKGSTKQVSRHYAILNTELAKKFIREKEKVYVYDRDDGKRRIAIDFSNDVPEFEAEHLVKGDSDAERWKLIFDDVAHKRSYLPSVQSNMLDIILGVQKEYAEQIKKHLLVQDETLKTLRLIQKSLSR